jgi:hypothetical protein
MLMLNAFLMWTVPSSNVVRNDQATEVQSSEEPEPNIWNKVSIIATIGSGFLTLIILAVQIKLLRRTLNATEENAAGALAAANATEESARISQQSIDLARAEFTATQRPKLLVRELHIFPPTPTHPTVGVRFVIANSGAGPAEIVESHIELQLIENFVILPLQPAEVANPIGNTVIEPGGHIYKEYDSRIGDLAFMNERNRQWQNSAEPHTKVWFRGFLVYADKNGLKRRTAFCRGYDFRAHRFRVGSDPDYEYAD